MTEENSMEMITIPKSAYVALIGARDELEDIIAFDRAMEGSGEGLPHEFMIRLIGGANALNVFRNWRGYSQSELARMSNVNRVQIADIEAGRKTGSVKTLGKLADALGVTIDEIV